MISNGSVSGKTSVERNRIHNEKLKGDKTGEKIEFQNRWNDRTVKVLKILICCLYVIE